MTAVSRRRAVGEGAWWWAATSKECQARGHGSSEVDGYERRRVEESEDRKRKSWRCSSFPRQPRPGMRGALGPALETATPAHLWLLPSLTAWGRHGFDGHLIALLIELAPTRPVLRYIRLPSHLHFPSSSPLCLDCCLSRSCRSLQAETAGSRQASHSTGRFSGGCLSCRTVAPLMDFSSGTPAAPANRVFLSVKSMQDTARHIHAISSQLQTTRTSPLSRLSIGCVPNEIDVTARCVYLATQQHFSIKVLFNPHE